LTIDIEVDDTAWASAPALEPASREDLERVFSDGESGA